MIPQAIEHRLLTLKIKWLFLIVQGSNIICTQENIYNKIKRFQTDNGVTDMLQLGHSSLGLKIIYNLIYILKHCNNIMQDYLHRTKNCNFNVNFLLSWVVLVL